MRPSNATFVDVAGNDVKLSDYREKRALVIAMTGTGCPLCKKYAPTLKKLENEFAKQGVAFIFVNPNKAETMEKINAQLSTHAF